MTWFKVDDNLALHPKVLQAGNAAIGMWVRAGAWSAQQLTDGFIPNTVIGTLGNRRLARTLVDVGLWTETDSGFQFHEWSERQPSRAHVERERKAAATRKAAWRERQSHAGTDPVTDGGSHAGTKGVPNGVPNGDVTAGVPPTHARAATRPDPTRPVVPTEIPRPNSKQRASAPFGLDPTADEPPF
jgi:hypothetical protein